MIILFSIVAIDVYSQTCDEIMEQVKSADPYGTAYSSYTSEAIRKVTFHEVTDDSYNTYYFAIVQFTSSYNEYIYQVSSSTKFNYSLDHYTSAGKAFWDHIYPYHDQLGCGPDLD